MLPPILQEAKSRDLQIEPTLMHLITSAISLDVLTSLKLVSRNEVDLADLFDPNLLSATASAPQYQTLRANYLDKDGKELPYSLSISVPNFKVFPRPDNSFVIFEDKSTSIAPEPIRIEVETGLARVWQSELCSISFSFSRK